MRQTFIEKRFSFDTEMLLDVINGILAEYGRDGYDLSLRQLYYQLVARDLIENTEKSYARIGSLVSDARMAGRIDWGMITDRGRTCVKNPHWKGAEDFMRNVAPQFRLDLWEGQRNYVEVMVEKQALEGILIPVCKRWDVPFTANKGYTSSSALYQAGGRFTRAAKEGRDLHILYLGDHDPSGMDMGRDIEERLDLFIGTMLVDDGEKARWITLHRIALNMEQVRALNPPENPAKMSDSRAQGYVKKYGNSSWELDAIEPTALVKLVTREIQALLNLPLFRTWEETQELTRKNLLERAGEYLGNDDEDTDD